MGDWADMYDYGYEPPDSIQHKDIRDSKWNCKDGTQIAIGDMTDCHLLNAFKMFGSENLFREMVVRLFEQKIMGRSE